MSDTIHDLVIVGAGPAGLSASIYARRALLDTIAIEQEAVGGQVILTSEIDNYPGVPHTDGFTLVDTMRAQAEELGANIVMDVVQGLDHDAEEGLFTVRTSQESYRTRTVIACGGATPRKAGFEGEDQFAGRGVSYCATCDGMFYRGKQVFVIGGGNSACEEALFLTRFASRVTLVVRKDHLRAQRIVAQQLEEHPKIDIRFLTSIVGVSGDTYMDSIDFRDNSTGKVSTETFDAGSFGIFVFVGRVPASALVKDFVEQDELGYVMTREDLSTATPGLFVAGDMRQKSLRQIVTAAADGAIAATSVAAYLGQPIAS